MDARDEFFLLTGAGNPDAFIANVQGTLGEPVEDSVRFLVREFAVHRFLK